MLVLLLFRVVLLIILILILIHFVRKVNDLAAGTATTLNDVARVNGIVVPLIITVLDCYQLARRL